MTNDENTYIGMSLPEGIRYITVFERGDFCTTSKEYSGHSTVRKTGRKLLNQKSCSIWEEDSHQTKTRISCWPLK